MDRKTNTKLGKSTKRKLITILKRNDVIKAGIFGSYARGEAKKIAILISS